MTNEVTTGSQAGVLSADDMALMMGDASARPDFGQDDMLTPTLRLIQSGSGALKRGTQEYIQGAAEGQFLDTLRRIPMDTCRIIPVHYVRTFIETKKVGNSRELVKLWGDDRSGYDAAHGDFGARTTDEGTEIAETATYYALLLDEAEQLGAIPVVMHLGSTQWKAAKRLNTLAGTLTIPSPQGSFLAPMFARAYTATSVRATKGENAWMQWNFDPDALTLKLPNGKALYEQAKAFREAVMRGEVKTAPPEEAGRPAAPGNDAPSDDIPFD
jgi:hypothetical protein